jgi:hypothetical protein
MKVPVFTQRMKEIINQITELLSERRKFEKRVRDGQIYFKKNLTTKEVRDGLATVQKMLKGIEEIDLEIRDLLTEFTIILEEKCSGLKFSIEKGGKEINFVPEKMGDEVEISPEDIWFYQISRKLFDISFKDIKFIKEND